MRSCKGWVGFALGAVLVLPPPGTTSRSRDFCKTWLALTSGQRQDVLARADVAESRSDGEAACRAGLRPGLRHKLDAECRNWSALMDFEVRAIVDGVLEPCRGSQSR